MKLENEFQVQAPPERAWALLLDIPRVIPCMPGAKLTEVVDDEHWKAKMSVKLGPISLAFATDVTLGAVDEAERTVRMTAKARELRGRGAGEAAIESRLTPADGGTTISIVTDLTLTGAVAQYGRGIVQDVSSQLVRRFADCLEAQLVAEPAAAEAAVAESAKPVGGLSLGFGALLRSLGRLFRRG
jgi:uncharacterized protein